LIDGDAEDLAAAETASDDSSDDSTSDESDSDDESCGDDGNSEESNVTDKPPPPPPKPSRSERLGGADGVDHRPNHTGHLPRTRATTMKVSHSDATASSVSLDLGDKGRLSIAQRLRNSKSMEMLRRGKSLDLPPPPPIPYQTYRPKRATRAVDTGPSPLSQPSSGSLGRSPPTPMDTVTTMTGEGSTSTWSSKTSLESDKNKPLPDPIAKVGSDPDRIPDAPRRDPDATPKIAQKKPKLKKVNEEIKPPELTYIPKLLPIFIELLSDNLTQIVKRG